MHLSIWCIVIKIIEFNLYFIYLYHINISNCIFLLNKTGGLSSSSCISFIFSHIKWAKLYIVSIHFLDSKNDSMKVQYISACWCIYFCYDYPYHRSICHQHSVDIRPLVDHWIDNERHKWRLHSHQGHINSAWRAAACPGPLVTPVNRTRPEVYSLIFNPDAITHLRTSFSSLWSVPTREGHDSSNIPLCLTELM